MSEMMERVARAVYSAAAEDVPAVVDPFNNGITERERLVARRIARAAIEAMREPTLAMENQVRAVESAYDNHEVIPWEMAWRAAIDEALK